MSLLSYSTYKDSGVPWLGAVPNHWDIVPFKRLVEIQNGADHKAIEQNEGIPVIGSGGPFAFASDFLYDGESVLLGRKGTIDKPLYITGKFWTVDTMYWTKIIPHVSGRFAYYTALIIPFDLYSTNTAVPSMTKGALNAHLVGRPPLDEQNAIAAFLDGETTKIDVLIREQEKLITLLAEKRKATISHAVTHGINPTAPMKDSGVDWIGFVPSHWAVVPLGRRYSVQLGKMLDSAKISGDQLRPYLRVFDVQWGSINTENLPLMDFDEEAREKYRLARGDILVNEGGSYPGRSAIWTGTLRECYYQKALHRLRPHSVQKDTSDFFYFVMSWAANQGVFVAGGNEATIEHLPAEKLRHYRFAFPPITEQQQIASFLIAETAKLDALQEQAERGIALLKECRITLIAAVVTGQIDVRGMAMKKTEQEQLEAMAK